MRIAAAILTCTLAGLAGNTWTRADQERFLRNAAIVDELPASQGSTKSMKARLSDGRQTHYAHIQQIDIYQPLWKGKDGSEERDFKDSWKFNVAAYRLALLLHLTNMVPVTVERVVDGKPSAVTWWVDDVLMDEKKRVLDNIAPPDPVVWRKQMEIIRVFDQLIYNVDRNRENLLITRDWKVWMIDHTRAFRKQPVLMRETAITVCAPELLASLKKLRRADVEREIGRYVTAEEIDGLMTRRDRIVELLDAHMR